MKQSSLAPILIVLLIALGIGGYFGYTDYLNKQTTVTPVPETPSDSTFVQVTPIPTSSDETANWKTYTSIKNGFSIGYPDDKKVEINETDTIKHSCHNNPAIVELLIYPSGYVKSQAETHFTGELWVDISIVNNKDKLSPEEFLKKNCSYLYTDSKIQSQTDIEIDNSPGLKLEYKNVLGAQEEVIVQKDNKLYFIHGFRGTQSKEQFDQILSTFKFTQ